MVKALVLMGSGEEHSWHQGLLAIAERWVPLGSTTSQRDMCTVTNGWAARSLPAAAADRDGGEVDRWN
jgi:hypothetical protein